jgi:hypothetical protein
MSNLSELFPAGAGKEVSFVASGTIATGDTVILNSDGTVSAVSGQNYSSGSEVVFDSDDLPQDTVAVYDTTGNRVVIVYRDGNDGWAVVGNVSGSSITFGTPVAWQSNNWSVTQMGLAYDSNADKIVIVYRNNTGGDYGYAIVGNVTSNSASFGTPVVFSSASTQWPIAVFDSDQNKVVVYYLFNGVNAKVGTVSGTSISFGSEVDLTDGEGGEGVNAVFDSNANKHVVTFYKQGGGGSTAESRVGTVSGTSISFGSLVQFATGAQSSRGRPMAFDSINNKVVIFFTDTTTSAVFNAVVGTVSGTSISYGTPVASSLSGLDSVALMPPQATFDSDSGVVACVIETSSVTYLVTGKVNGTSIDLDEPIILNGGDEGRNPAITYDPDQQKAIIAYTDIGSSNDGTAVVVALPYTNVTDDNFLGISKSAISNAASGSITIKGGVSSNVSGLTPNSTYYVANDGTLTTTSTGNVLGGRALSATSIDLDYST